MEKTIFKWLNPNNNQQYNWEEVTEKILKLSYKIKNIIQSDRVLLVRK